MAHAKQVSSIDKVFGDATTKQKTGLVLVYKGRNVGLETVDQSFGEQLHRAVLQRNRPESVCSARTIFFREENKVGSINAVEIDIATVQTIEKSHDIRLHIRPERAVKGGAETVRAWARGGVGGEDGAPHLVSGERDGDRRTVDRGSGVEGGKIKIPGARTSNAQEAIVEAKENVRLGPMASKLAAILLEQTYGALPQPSGRRSMEEARVLTPWIAALISKRCRQ